MPKQGIRWSIPTLVTRNADGALTVVLPEQVAAHFDVGDKDVLNWTLMPDGTVETWSIKKSTYSSLGDREKEK
ncbi:MAG TPA: hypothetical protein VM491_02355 [Burkholderiaceae bacterium]|jgi:hypothetical protein|nr:hypothetical protein [Burkholderiaceae bacterium]